MPQVENAQQGLRMYHLDVSNSCISVPVLVRNLCALKTLKFYQEECDLRNAWFEICDQVVSLQGVAPPKNSECYSYRQHLQSLHVPFAAYFAEKLGRFPRDLLRTPAPEDGSRKSGAEGFPAGDGGGHS